MWHFHMSWHWLFALIWNDQWRTYVQGIQGMPCPFEFGAPMLDK